MKNTAIGFTLLILTGTLQSETRTPLVRTAVYAIKSEVLPKGFTEILTNHIESELLSYTGHQVISRSNLDVLITEDHLSQSGLTGNDFRIVDNDGRLSVDKICTGSVSRIDHSYSFTLKLIDVNSARIDASTQTIYSGPMEGLLDIGSELLSRIILPTSQIATNVQHTVSNSIPSDKLVATPQPLPEVQTINRKEVSQQSAINLPQKPVRQENNTHDTTEDTAETPESKTISELGRNISVGSIIIFTTLTALVVFTRTR